MRMRFIRQLRCCQLKPLLILDLIPLFHSPKVDEYVRVGIDSDRVMGLKSSLPLILAWIELVAAECMDGGKVGAGAFLQRCCLGLLSIHHDRSAFMLPALGGVFCCLPVPVVMLGSLESATADQQRQSKDDNYLCFESPILAGLARGQ